MVHLEEKYKFPVKFGYSRIPFLIIILMFLVLNYGSWISLYYRGDVFGYSGLTILVFLSLTTLLILTLPGLFTNHKITQDRIVLRIGWLVNNEIKHEEIREIKTLKKRGPFILPPIKLIHGKTFITTSNYNLILIELKKPRYFYSVGFRRSQGKSDKVIINVNDPDKFLQVLKSLNVPKSGYRLLYN